MSELLVRPRNQSINQNLPLCQLQARLHEDRLGLIGGSKKNKKQNKNGSVSAEIRVDERQERSVWR
jgi:hypothetical protein